MGHAISSAGGGAGAAGDEGYPREGSTKARHVAWAAVLLTGWLLGYSIGWQRGWLVGNSGSDEQLDGHSIKRSRKHSSSRHRRRRLSRRGARSRNRLAVFMGEAAQRYRPFARM